jgi:hypothetical protein
VLSKERTNVPINITIRLEKVKYLTSLNGLTFSSDGWRFIDKVYFSEWEYLDINVIIFSSAKADSSAEKKVLNSSF